MPKMKIKQTPDFIRGLLVSADLVSDCMEDGEFHPRENLTKENDITRCAPETLREYGMYQGRVILVAFAAELALKWLWELENGKAAAKEHALNYWFRKLTCEHQEAIKEEYQRLAPTRRKGWESADKVFQKCNKAFENWRYIVEEDRFPNYVMQATHLEQATLSVLAVAETIAGYKEQPQRPIWIR